MVKLNYPVEILNDGKLFWYVGAHKHVMDKCKIRIVTLVECKIGGRLKGHVCVKHPSYVSNFV